MKGRVKRNVVIVGNPRTGKSHLSGLILDSYISAGYSAAVFNVGMATDFKQCRYGDLILPDEIADRKGLKGAERTKFVSRSNIDFFSSGGKYHKLSDMPKMGKAFKFDRNVYANPYIYRSISAHLYGMAVFLDDNRGNSKRITDFVNLCSTLNHCGKKHSPDNPGVDLFQIYQNISTVPGEILGYANELVLFPFSGNETQIQDTEFNEIVYELKKHVFSLPKYSYIWVKKEDTLITDIKIISQ